MVRRFASILLAAWFALAATGWLEFSHNQQHREEDRAAALAAREAGLPDEPTPAHDDSNCLTHLQLHLPAIAGGWVAVVIVLGLLSLLGAQRAMVGTPARVVSTRVCRGPPVG